MNKKTKETLLVLFKSAIALSLFTIAIINYDKLKNLDVNALLGQIDDYWVSVAIILGVYVMKSLVFVLPASLIYVAVGVIYDGFTASVINMTGILLEITITYFLGRFLGGETVRKFIAKKKNGNKLLQMNIQENSKILFTIRLLPAFPIDFVSLFYGASGVGFPKYAVLSFVGLAPRVIAFTILGSAAFDWIPLDKIILLLVMSIPVGVVYYLIKKLIIDRRREKKDDKNQ